jgi:PAS domain S-box-containing protein
MPSHASAQTDFRQPPRLLARFAVYAGLAVVFAAVGALLLARFNAGSEAESDLSEDAAYVADELGRDDLARTAFIARVTADEKAQLDDLLGRVAAARAVERASLVSPGGTITYSTEHGLIGRPERALNGNMLTSRVQVRWLLDATRTRGTLVVQRDADAVAAEVRRSFLTQAALVVLALLLLYAALIPVFKRVTAALAEREARYRSLMEQASDAIFVADPNGRLMDVNEKACALLGYHQDELLGKHAMELMSIRDVAKLPLHMAELAAGKTILDERPVRKKDGSFLIGDISAKKLDDGRVLASIRDVTDRKRLENELREAHKLEAVGRFAGGIADDFSELLGSIALHTDALARRVGSDADLDEIRSATQLGGSLTSQLLAVGSKQTLHPESLDVNHGLSMMHKVLKGMVGERVKLLVRPGEGVDHIYADPEQIEKVIVDLVLHARDGMPGGGTITIETANVDFSQNGRSRRTAGGRHVMLAISDTGDRRDSESRPFGDAEEDGGERLGLGLAAVYGVVHQSGGSIGIESEPGVGTTVRIYLPSTDAAAELHTALSGAQSS